jgi:hypothetical protein
MHESARPIDPRHTGWYATADHPRGCATLAAFEVLGSMVYPAVGHPAGASTTPWYQVRGVLAYPVEGHPDGPSNEPSFRIAAPDVFPAIGDPSRDAAWFRIGPPPCEEAP